MTERVGQRLIEELSRSDSSLPVLCCIQMFIFVTHAWEFDEGHRE